MDLPLHADHVPPTWPKALHPSVKCARLVCAAAVDDFGRAIALEPRYADAWKRRGQARAALGENEAALQASAAPVARCTAHCALCTGERLLQGMYRHRAGYTQDLRKAADLTADRTGKADCQLEAGMILQKQKDYRAATTAMEVRH